MSRSRRTWLICCLPAAGLLAVACGSSVGVQSVAAVPPEPAASTEAPTAPPTEAPTAASTEAPTAPPTEAPTAAPTEAPTAPPEPAAEPSSVVSPTSEPAAEPSSVVSPTSEPAPEPPATDEPADEQPGTPAAEGDILDTDEVSALASRIVEAQSTVTSSRVALYLTMRVGFEDEAPEGFDDLPVGVWTAVGDLAHVEMDIAALMASDPAQELEESAGFAAHELPPLEVVTESKRHLYVKLEPMIKAGSTEPGATPDPDELPFALAGRDMADLWVHLDLAEMPIDMDAIGQELGLGLMSQPSLTDLLSAAVDKGGILEVRRGAEASVDGLDTVEYGFSLDMMRLGGELSSLLGGVMGGEDWGDLEDLENAGLTALPVDLVLHIDGDDLIRRGTVQMDLGALLTGMMAGFGELTAPGDGAEALPAGFDYFVEMRFEVLAVNDPSLSVSLPDPALVVEFPLTQFF